MAITFTIATVAKDLQQGWHISETLNGRNVMNFEVNSYDGTYRPAARAVVEFKDGATYIFGGTIETLDEGGLGGHGVTPITTKVGVIDFNALPDRRMLEITIPAGTLKAALQQIEPYLTGFSVTLDPAQVVGPSHADPLIFELGNLTSILNKLSVITGYAWEISYSRVLKMFAPGTTTAWAITASDGQADGDITASPSLVDYANYIIGRFLNEGRVAYAILNASQNWINGETVIVGSKTYTFKTAITGADNVDGNVHLGGTISESLDTLHRAITLDPTAGTDYALSMTVNSQATAYRSGSGPGSLVVQALQAGVAGNSIAVASNNPDTTWTVAGSAIVTTLEFGADESLTNEVIADSGAATADRVEKVITLSDIRDEATAQALVDGYLVRSLVEPREIHYRTRVSGLHPGMRQSITEPKRNISGYCLITAVDITCEGSTFFYNVTAVEGTTIVPSYQDTYKAWNGSGSGSTMAVSTSGGGGSSTVLSAPVSLGGLETASIPMATPAVRKKAWNYMPFYPTTDVVVLVRTWSWVRNAAVGAIAYIVREGDNAIVGTAATETATSRPTTPKTFYVSMTAGQSYRLEVVSTVDGESVYCLGSLEAA